MKRLFGTVLMGLTMLACTPDARWALAEALTDLATCGLKNMDLPDEEIFLRCGAKTLEDRQRLMRIVGDGRAQAAAQASAAADRAREETIRAAVAGAVGACR